MNQEKDLYVKRTWLAPITTPSSENITVYRGSNNAEEKMDTIVSISDGHNTILLKQEEHESLPNFIQRLDKLSYEIYKFKKYLKELDNKPNIVDQEVIDFKSAPNFTRSTRFKTAIGQDVIKVNDTLGVSPSTLSYGIQWCNSETGSFGIKSDVDGKQNTLDILNNCPIRPIAASVCSTFGDGNWYLPAIDQLITIYKNKDSINAVADGYFITAHYWSSTEYSDGRVLEVNFYNGNMAMTVKGTLNLVRGVRDFI